jgi:hypothetical protein
MFGVALYPQHFSQNSLFNTKIPALLASTSGDTPC